MSAKKIDKKQDLARFLTSEEGKIVKGDVVKIAAILGLIGVAAQEASAYHNNYFTANAHYSSGDNHNSHSSHGSHGSHGQW